MYQIIYEMRDEGAVEIARIKDGQITGPEASKMKQILIKLGWPKKPADEILWGSYLWATEPIPDDDKDPDDLNIRQF